MARPSPFGAQVPTRHPLFNVFPFLLSLTWDARVYVLPCRSQVAMEVLEELLEEVLVMVGVDRQAAGRTWRAPCWQLSSRRAPAGTLSQQLRRRCGGLCSMAGRRRPAEEEETDGRRWQPLKKLLLLLGG